jgi:glycosyltransferase involved in cell wall biosynthesis
MDNCILLSIGIPTYNGEATIREAIESVASQMTEEVEVVVCDNASTDNTAHIVEEYSQQHQNIKYFRNSKNIGGSQNMNMIMNRSRGKFVWALGDDDKIAPGGVAKILSIIRQNEEYAFIFSNLSIWNRDFSSCISQKFLALETDQIIENQDVFLKMLGANAAFTPCLIMNRAIWLRIPNSVFDETGWITLYRIYVSLHSRKAYLVNFPYAIFRDGSTRHHQDGMFFMQTLGLIDFYQILPIYGYDARIVEEKILGVMKNLPWTIILQKECGLKINSHKLKRAVRAFGSYPFFWIACIPLLLCPAGFFKIAMHIARLLKRWLRSHL